MNMKVKRQEEEEEDDSVLVKYTQNSASLNIIFGADILFFDMVGKMMCKK